MSRLQRTARRIAQLKGKNEYLVGSFLEQVQSRDGHLSLDVIVKCVESLSGHDSPLPPVKDVVACARQRQKRLLKQAGLAPPKPSVPYENLAVVAFHDANGGDQHTAFMQWRHAHPRGFVVNCGETPPMLHKAQCRLLEPNPTSEGEGVSLTANRKLCSKDRQDLKKCALQEYNRQVQRCEVCNP